MNRKGSGRFNNSTERSAKNPHDIERMLRMQGGSATGISVTDDTALRVAAVYGCVRILSECIASLPFNLYSGKNSDNRQVDEKHLMQMLLTQRPNNIQTSYDFMRTVVSHLAMRGNAYIEKVAFGTSFPQLIARNPFSVEVKSNLDTYEVEYVVTREDGRKDTLPRARMIHIRSGATRDGVVGLSPIEAAAESIGVSLAAERHGGATFKNSAKPSGVFTLPAGKRLSDENYKRLKEDLDDTYSGHINAGRTMLLEDGLTWSQTSMTPAELQFLDTRKFQRSEIAMFWGVPPHMLGDVDKATSWGSGIEQQGYGFVNYSLMPWLMNICKAFGLALLTPQELITHVFQFDVSQLIRADQLSRQNAFAVQYDRGIITTNEWRAREGLNPVADGDQLKTGTGQANGTQKAIKLAWSQDADDAQSAA